MKASKLVKWLCVVIAACHLAACATSPNFGTQPSQASSSNSSGSKAGAVVAGAALIGLAWWLWNREKQLPAPEEREKEAPSIGAQPQAVNLPSF
jgi:hypothetical protein